MQNNRGFTLIELVIVMSIIGIIYTIMIQNFSLDKKEESLSVKNLPEFLRKHYEKDKSLIKLRCFDECSKCKIFKDGKMSEDEVNLFQGRPRIDVYIMGMNMLKKIEFSDYFINEYDSKKVCFEYTLYPNGSTDKLILEYNDKAYLFDNFKKPTKIFERVEDAREYWEEEKSSYEE